eukprot:scaffold6689_cov120-Isochrysis_galbana.AAC.1
MMKPESPRDEWNVSVFPTPCTCIGSLCDVQKRARRGMGTECAAPPGGVMLNTHVWLCGSPWCARGRVPGLGELGMNPERAHVAARGHREPL